MKRLDEEPTCEIARESLKHDQLGRREIVAQFIHLLYSVKGPYSIFIDAPWGTGKTFFVKQIIALIGNFIRTLPIFIRTCADEYGNPIP